jgi:hypothetical protein
MKASRWWNNKELLLDVSRKTASRLQKDGRRRYLAKPVAGRGRKRQHWVNALYTDLLDTFRSFRRSGFKVISSIVRQLAT